MQCSFGGEDDEEERERGSQRIEEEGRIERERERGSQRTDGGQSIFRCFR